jgi:hypothetical protein
MTADAALPDVENDDDTVPAPSPKLAWHTRRFLIVFFTIGFAIGATDPTENSDLEFLLSVGLAFSMAWWTITDASDRGHPFRLSIRLLVIVFGGFAAPLYVLWTRRWKGIVWIVLVALGLVIASEAGYYLPRLAFGELGPFR